MDPRPPLVPDLGHYRKRAKALKRAHAAGDVSAALRFSRSHPKLARLPVASVLAADVSLADAQRVIAREHGMASWAELKAAVETAPSGGPTEAERLVHAIRIGDASAIDELLGATPSLAQTPAALVEACDRGQLALVDRLLHAGADPKGHDALLAAIHAGPSKPAPALDVVARLIERGAPYDVFTMAALGRVDDLRVALSHVAVDARGPGDATPLFLAAWNGHVEAVRVLLDAGADANAICAGTSVWKKVSLHLWSERHRAVARALLDHGASCSFAEACTLGHVATIDRLLVSDPTAVDRAGPSGKTPLDVAVLDTDVALARRLLEAGASDPRGRAHALVAATVFADRDVSRQVHRRSTFALDTFHDCSFADTTFSNVNLAGARFDNVNLGGVRIDDAHVTGMTIYGIEIEPLLRKELERRAKSTKKP